MGDLDFDDVEFIYRLQGRIIHHGGNCEERGKAIEIFNSMPLPYRKHGYQNYEGDGLSTDWENYSLAIRR